MTGVLTSERIYNSFMTESEIYEITETEKNSVWEEQDKAAKYEDSGIDERILRAVKEMGFSEMTPIQAQAIPLFMKGWDVIGQAQTGTGKTAAFGIPMLQKINPANRALQGMILCPTRELAMQAAEELRKYSKYMHGIRVLAVYGGQDITRQIKALKGGVQIIVGTPGRVMDHMRRHTIKMDELKMVVLDEADEMLDMGFREDMETILEQIPGEHQTALFSATMPEPILNIAERFQKDAVLVKVTKEELTIDLVKQYLYLIKREDKEEAVVRLLDFYQLKKALIFCNTKTMVNVLSENLKNRGYEAEGLHGDLTQNQRDIVMRRFRDGSLQILIATDVAARGIDVSGVDGVINYDVPQDIEYYVHRIGRTGRAGKEGLSFTLAAVKELYKIREIEKLCKTRLENKKLPSAHQVKEERLERALQDIKSFLEKEQGRSFEETKDYVETWLKREEVSALELAAAFIYQKTGGDLPEIQEEERPRPRRKKAEKQRPIAERSGNVRGMETRQERNGRARGKETRQERNSNVRGMETRQERSRKPSFGGLPIRTKGVGKLGLDGNPIAKKAGKKNRNRHKEKR